MTAKFCPTVGQCYSKYTCVGRCRSIDEFGCLDDDELKGLTKLCNANVGQKYLLVAYQSIPSVE